MSDYPAGTVAVATVRGVKGVRVVRVDRGGLNEWSASFHWLTPEPVQETEYHRDEHVTDIRPLVVLDLNDAPWVGPGTIPNLLREFARTDHYGGLAPRRVGATNWLADQIEAQTKPPRIPEPGPWGVVEAAVDGTKVRRRFVRHDTSSDYGPWHSKDARWARWDDLIDPVLIREGVES